MSLLTPTRRSSATIPCDPQLIYEILTDYDHYSEWLPLITQSKSLATEGDLAIAEFEVALAGKIRFVVECIHTRNKMVLWRTIEGKVAVTQVEWTIESGGPSQSRVALNVASRLQLFSNTRNFLNPAACLRALQAQVASFTPEIAISDETGEKILDLAETDDGVVCWIRGKKYVLKEERP